MAFTAAGTAVTSGQRRDWRKEDLRREDFAVDVAIRVLARSSAYSARQSSGGACLVEDMRTGQDLSGHWWRPGKGRQSGRLAGQNVDKGRSDVILSDVNRHSVRLWTTPCVRKSTSGTVAWAKCNPAPSAQGQRPNHAPRCAR
jgi:hypothetical protein